MSSNCKHLIVNTTKTVQHGVAAQDSNFHCALKRASKEDAKVINKAFQRQTLVSVAGYTCYYHDNKVVKLTDCPKFRDANK
jgi:hypothetical protein